MKTWSIDTNFYHRTASYYLSEGPWWAYLIEWLNFEICHVIGHIPLVNRLDDLWHIYVCNNVWHWTLSKRAEWEVPVDLGEVIERHTEKRDWFWEQEKKAREMRDDEGTD